MDLEAHSVVPALWVSTRALCKTAAYLPSCVQGSLMLKILRGRYPPLTGYSRELTEVVKACLTLVRVIRVEREHWRADEPAADSTTARHGAQQGSPCAHS